MAKYTDQKELRKLILKYKKEKVFEDRLVFILNTIMLSLIERYNFHDASIPDMQQEYLLVILNHAHQINTQ